MNDMETAPGRNAPCPCGSGKKYKRCCLGKKPFSKPVGKIGRTRFDEVRRDVPVVDEEGFRIVAPAQASMDYAQPLWDQVQPETKEQMQNMLNAGMALWNLALEERRKGRKSELRETVVKTLARSGLPTGEDFVDRMVERHHAMFPDLGGGGFYQRERVVDPLPPWTPFPEDLVPRGSPPATDEESDRKTRQALEEYDGLLRDGNAETLEREFSRIGSAFENGFGAWCERSGMEPEDVHPLVEVAGRFMDFLARYRGEPLGGNPEDCVSEFLMAWLFRKARLEGGTHSAAPPALRMLGRYLDALGHTKGLEKRLHQEYEARRPGFERTLEAFYGPPTSDVARME